MRVDLDDQENLEPNLAPLLDCIFLLLIFFLVATTFEKQKQDDHPIEELSIQLPSSAAALGALHHKASTTVIAINRRGHIFLNNQRISTSELHVNLKAIAEKNPQQNIRIDGDRNTPLQHIVHLIDLCEFEGLRNISIRAASDVEY